MMGQRVIVLGVVAQDIGRRYEGRIIKVKKVLQVVEKKKKSRSDGWDNFNLVKWVQGLFSFFVNYISFG